jgi:hypothetical protein
MNMKKILKSLIGLAVLVTAIASGVSVSASSFRYAAVETKSHCWSENKVFDGKEGKDVNLWSNKVTCSLNADYNVNLYKQTTLITTDIVPVEQRFKTSRGKFYAWWYGQKNSTYHYDIIIRNNEFSDGSRATVTFKDLYMTNFTHKN